MCRVVKPISEKQNLLEEALGKALENYLKNRKFLKNAGGEMFYFGQPACRSVCLSPYNEENQIEALLESNGNFHPYLHVRALMKLKKEGDSNYSEAQYHILIHGDRSSVGGNSDYELLQTNEGYEMTIKGIDYCIKDEDRLY